MAQKKKKRYYHGHSQNQSLTGILNQNQAVMKEIALEPVEDFLLKFNLHELDIDVVKVDIYNLKKEIYDCFVARGKSGNYKRSLVARAYRWKYGKTLREGLIEFFTKGYEVARQMRDLRPMFFDSQFREVYDRNIRRCEVISKDLYDSLIEKNETYKSLHYYIQEERRRIDSMIFDSIPEKVTDLYPLARQIKRHFIMHVGPTNSGKTHDSIEALKKAGAGIYLAPLRLLAYEIYDRINEAGIPCNMITGEEEILIDNARITSATIETLDILKSYDLAVIDEGQLIGERQRGGAWTKAILGVCAKTVHICSDESCVDVITKIIGECGDTYEIIKHERAVPLEYDKRAFVFPDTVEEKDALIVFSKKSVIAVAAELQKIGIKSSIIYGALPYDVRMNEVRRFIEGETSVVVATDAIGMGLNLPIKRMVFLELQKFDGEKRRSLNVTEIKQIAGRAGRRGIFDVGYYNSEYQKQYIKSAVTGILPPVKKARIALPESIIHLDLPLSDIMRRWIKIHNEDLYEKADIEEDISICMELEKIVGNKPMLYEMITIAFDKGKTPLVRLLKELASNQTIDKLDDRIVNLVRIVDSNLIVDDDILGEMSLEELETLYSRYDLLYGFLRKFGYRAKLDDIVVAKRECSKHIMGILKEQTLETKKCVVCGQELGWNYPYNKCEECFVLQRKEL